MAQRGKGKGKKKEKGNTKKTKNRDPKPNSNSILKPQIISDILSRLSVKTLLRFRLVCKEWRKLISKTDFIATHFRHSSSLQRTDSPLIIQAVSNCRTFLQYKLNRVVELDNPYPSSLNRMSIAGPVNGIFLIFQPSVGDVLTLWNPAMRMSRMVNPSKSPEDLLRVSVGLAFDYQKNDLLILRVFRVRPFLGCKESKVKFEIHSMQYPLGWTKLKSNSYFYIDRNACDAIFQGEPFWLAYITENHISSKYERLMRFRVSKMQFDWFPLPSVGEGDYDMKLTNFEDSLGLLTLEERNNSYVDIWEGNIEEYDWNMICRVQLSGIERILGRLRNGEIITDNGEGVLVRIDPATSSVKSELYLFAEIFDCPESLLLIEGMVPVKQQAEIARECKGFMQKLDPIEHLFHNVECLFPNM